MVSKEKNRKTICILRINKTRGECSHADIKRLRLSMNRCFVFTQSFERAECLAEEIKKQETAELICMMCEIPKSTLFVHSFVADIIIIDGYNDAWKAYQFGNTLLNEKISAELLFIFHDVDYDLIEKLKEIETLATILYHPEDSCSLDLSSILISDRMRTDSSTIFQEDLDMKVTKMLEDFGFSPHLKGFYYIRSGILYMYCSGQNHAMKVLYKEIARQYATTSSRVEKAIRTSIDYAYKNRYEVLVVEGRKPTNSQLIHKALVRLRIIEELVGNKK